LRIYITENTGKMYICRQVVKRLVMLSTLKKKYPSVK